MRLFNADAGFFTSFLFYHIRWLAKSDIRGVARNCLFQGGDDKMRISRMDCNCKLSSWKIYIFSTLFVVVVLSKSFII